MNANIDITGVVLTTERLALRPWRPGDLEDLYAYASVPGVGEMAGWPHHEDRETSKGILERFIEGKKTFALEYQGKVIGSLGIERYDEAKFPGLADLRCREIGYVLAKDYWGRGLMPEAVRAAIDWLFAAVGLDAILCGHARANHQSGRVQEKCGFRHYAYSTYHTQMGTDVDDEMNILRREDWPGNDDTNRRE